MRTRFAVVVVLASFSWEMSQSVWLSWAET